MDWRGRACVALGVDEVSRAYEVKDGETKSVFGLASVDDDGVVFVDMVRVVGLDHGKLMDVDGKMVAYATATRRGHFLICAGGRDLEQQEEEREEEFSEVGVVVSRSSRVDGRDGTFQMVVMMIKQQQEEEEEEEEPMEDSSDSESGQENDDQQQQQQQQQQQKTFTLCGYRMWSRCPPGSRVAIRPSSNPHRCLVRCISAPSSTPQQGIVLAKIIMCVSPSRLLLEGSIHCILSHPMPELVAGCILMIHSAHPFAPNFIVVCPYASVVVVGFESPDSNDHNCVPLPALPLFCGQLPCVSLLCCASHQTHLPPPLLSSKHAFRGLLYASGLPMKQPHVPSAFALVHHSPSNCPYYDPSSAVAPPPLTIHVDPRMSTVMSPYPFAYAGNGPYVISIVDGSCVSLISSPLKREPVPPPDEWLVCSLSSFSTGDALLVPLDPSCRPLMCNRPQLPFLPDHLYCQCCYSHINMRPVPVNIVSELNAMRMIVCPPKPLLPPDCMCSLSSNPTSMLAFSDGHTLSCPNSDQVSPIPFPSSVKGPVCVGPLSRSGLPTPFSHLTPLEDTSMCPNAPKVVATSTSTAVPCIVLRVGPTSSLLDCGYCVASLPNNGNNVPPSVRLNCVVTQSHSSYAPRISPQSLLQTLDSIRRSKKPIPAKAPFFNATILQ